MLLHRAIEPSSDSTVVTTGELPTTNGGHGSPLPSLRVVEHFRWARLPQSESFSRLVHTLSEVWGKDSTVVTTGALPTTNAGHGSPLPSLRVVEHFRWARLPQSENTSRLVHVLSEVWGCRRVDAGVDRPQGRTPRIGTGVADIMHKPSGTFHPRPLNEHRNPDYPTEYPFRPRRGRSCACPSGVGCGGASHAPPTGLVCPPIRHPSPCHSDAPRGRRCRRCAWACAVLKVRLWRSVNPSPVWGRGRGWPPPPRHAKSPENPFRRRSIKTATSSIKLQSMFNQTSINVQSTFNQRSIKTPSPKSRR